MQLQGSGDTVDSQCEADIHTATATGRSEVMGGRSSATAAAAESRDNNHHQQQQQQRQQMQAKQRRHSLSGGSSSSSAGSGDVGGDSQVDFLDEEQGEGRGGGGGGGGGGNGLRSSRVLSPVAEEVRTYVVNDVSLRV